MKRIVVAAAVASVAVAACDGGNGDGEPAGTEAPAAEAPFDTSDWKTDFSEHSVPLDEFVGGGPPKDGIPSIDEPRYVSVADGDEFLAAREPVAVVELGGEARARRVFPRGGRMIRRLIAKRRYMREHRWTHSHLSEYIDEELRPDDVARVEAHVGICPHCRRVLATLRRTLEGLVVLRAGPRAEVAEGVIERLRQEP